MEGEAILRYVRFNWKTVFRKQAVVWLFLGFLAVAAPSFAGRTKPSRSLYNKRSYAAAMKKLSKGDVDGAVDGFCDMVRRHPGKKELWTLSVSVFCLKENIWKVLQSVKAPQPVFALPIIFKGKGCYRVCAGLATTRRGVSRLAVRFRSDGLKTKPFPMVVSCPPAEVGKTAIKPPLARVQPVIALLPAGTKKTSVQQPSNIPASPARFSSTLLMKPSISLETARRAAPSKEGEFWFRKGLKALRSGDNSAAEGAFQRSLAADPGRPEVLNNVGVIRIKEGRYEAAEKLFRRVLKERPAYAGAHLNLAGALWGLKHPVEAISEAKRATQLDPQDINGFLTLSSFYLSYGNADAAAVAAQRALLLEPKNKRAKALLAACARKAVK